MKRFCIKCGLPFVPFRDLEDVCFTCTAEEDRSRWVQVEQAVFILNKKED